MNIFTHLFLLLLLSPISVEFYIFFYPVVSGPKWVQWAATGRKCDPTGVKHLATQILKTTSGPNYLWMGYFTPSYLQLPCEVVGDPQSPSG